MRGCRRIIPTATDDKGWISRRRFVQTAAGAGAGIGALGLGGRAPWHFVRGAYAADQQPIGNFPIKGSEVVFGFNVPQTGSYADEGADELRAFKLAVKHLNEGGGMLETLKPSATQGQRAAWHEGQVRDRRHRDQAGSRSCQRPADDRARRRHHVQRRLQQRHRGRRAVPRPGEGRDLHVRAHPLQRHHRQGPQALRIPPLLQRLYVGPGAGADPGQAIRQGPPDLPPHRRLHLGPHPIRVDEGVHREGRLDDRQQHHDAARHDRLQPVPDRGAEQRCRRAGA